MDIKRYLAKEGEKIDLSKFSTVCDVDIDKEKVKTELMPQAIE